MTKLYGEPLGVARYKKVAFYPRFAAASVRLLPFFEMSSGFLGRLHEKIKLHGDEKKHEQTNRWSNRSLVYLLCVCCVAFSLTWSLFPQGHYSPPTCTKDLGFDGILWLLDAFVFGCKSRVILLPHLFRDFFCIGHNLANAECFPNGWGKFSFH